MLPSDFAYGLGNSLNILLAVMSFAWAAQMRWDLSWGEDQEEWHWARHDFCRKRSKRGFDCYFKPLLGADCLDVQHNEKCDRLQCLEVWRTVDTPRCAARQSLKLVMGLGYRVPLRGFEQHGTVWADAMAMAFIWQLDPAFEDFLGIEAKKAAIGLSRATSREWIGIHEEPRAAQRQQHREARISQLLRLAEAEPARPRGCGRIKRLCRRCRRRCC